MALTPTQQILAESYFGDNSHLMFDTSEDFSLAFNTAQEAVNQGHSWLEIYQTGGNKTFLRNLVVSKDPAEIEGSATEQQFIAYDAKGISTGIEYWLGNGYDENFIRQAMGKQGVSEDNLDRGFAYIDAKKQAGDRDIDLIFKASQLGVNIHSDMDNEKIQNAIDEHGDSQGGGSGDTSGQGGGEDADSGNERFNPTTLADSINVGGQEITFERLNPLIQYLNDNGYDTSIDTIRDAGDLNDPEILIDLFPPDMVARANLDGINLAGDLYPPDIPNNQIYYNELTGIFGNHISLDELSPSAEARIINEVGENVYRDFSGVWKDKTGSSDPAGKGIILDFDGEPITRGRAALSINARRGSKWYVSSLDYNKDGVIDARDLQEYGSNMARDNGISEPTHADIADVLNNSPVNVQTYVDIGFNNIAGEHLTEEEMAALSEEHYPGFQKAMDDYRAGRIDERTLRSFDFTGDGKIDFADFTELAEIAPVGTDDNLAFLDSILKPGGGGVNPRRERSTASTEYFNPVFQSVGLPDWTKFVLTSRADGLSDDEIRAQLRDKGANGDSIIQAFLGSENLPVVPDPNEGKAEGKTGSEIFKEKLEEARKGTFYGDINLQTAGRPEDLPLSYGDKRPGDFSAFLAPKKSPEELKAAGILQETPEHSERLKGILDSKEGQPARVKALKAKSEEHGGFKPYTPTMPEDAFAKAQKGLAGKTRESLDTLALGLGLKGSKRLSDSALKFRIASRQATNPEEVFSGTPPRVSAPKYPKEITEVKQTQAEAPSG